MSCYTYRHKEVSDAEGATHMNTTAIQIKEYRGAPCGTISPVAYQLPKVSNPRVGQYVAIKSRGDWRIAKITKVGRIRIGTAYTTKSAVATGERNGWPILTTNKSVDMDEARAIPAGLLEVEKA